MLIHHEVVHSGSYKINNKLKIDYLNTFIIKTLRNFRIFSDSLPRNVLYKKLGNDAKCLNKIRGHFDLSIIGKCNTLILYL